MPPLIKETRTHLQADLPLFFAAQFSQEHSPGGQEHEVPHLLMSMRQGKARKEVRTYEQEDEDWAFPPLQQEPEAVDWLLEQHEPDVG